MALYEQLTHHRPRLIAAAVAAIVLIAGLATVVAVKGRDDSAAARSVAERYLQLLADDTTDPTGLEDLVSTEDTAALERAGALLTRARARISEATLGESEEVVTATRASTLSAEADVRFDRFERFDVEYRLGDRQQSGTITLGRVSSGADDGWLVVTPLSGRVDWNSVFWGQALLDLEVGDVEVTDPDRTTYEPDPQFVHPGVYSVDARVGRNFRAAAVDMTVTAVGDSTPVPGFDLDPTPEGTAAITKQVVAAFEPCGSGTAYCPVLDLVQPRDRDLPEGWWRGLASDPAVTVDGTEVTLRDGEFRYLSPSGEQTVAFDGSTSVTIDPTTRQPKLRLPLSITRP